MISLADARIEVVLEGHRRNYRVTVELPGAAPLEEESKPSPRTAATEPALVLAAHERRLLAAICGPLLVGRGSRPGACQLRGGSPGVGSLPAHPAQQA